MDQFVSILRQTTKFDSSKISNEARIFEKEFSLLKKKHFVDSTKDEKDSSSNIKPLLNNNKNNMINYNNNGKYNEEMKLHLKSSSVAKELEASRINKIRKKNHIHVSGTEIPPPIETFASLLDSPYNVPPYIIRNVYFPSPTPIQMQSIPIMLNNRELFACSPTGSGKTLAYIIPILTRLQKSVSSNPITALILAPTNELVKQIARHFTIFSKGKSWKVLCLSKATANNTTFKNFHDIIVSTPNRLLKTIENCDIDLSNIQIIILDEADRLFSEKFIADTDIILDKCSNPLTIRCLYTATLPPYVEEVARTVLKDPIRCSIGTYNAAEEKIDQRLIFVGDEDGKLISFKQLLNRGIQPPVLIFVQSIERANDLYTELKRMKISVDVIHSGRTANARSSIINNFRMVINFIKLYLNYNRGMDFKNVKHVINYDFPQTTISYIHRIGRTGRAGRGGEAITFFTESDVDLLRSIANVMRTSGCDVPDWMLSLKKISKREKRKLAHVPPNREPISSKFKKRKRYQDIEKRKKFKNEHMEIKKSDT